MMRKLILGFFALIVATLPAPATQYLRPAASYAATTSYTANAAPTETYDLLWLMNRTAQKVTPGVGTQQWGTIKSFNTSERHEAIQDDVYAALGTAGVDFSDARYNSTSTPGTYSNTSETTALYNPGWHRLIVVRIGDSITNAKIGATTYKEFGFQKNQNWALGFDPASGKVTCATPGGSAGALTPPEYCATATGIADAKSMVVFNRGQDSWRLANQSGFNYQTPSALSGSPHNDNTNQFAKIYPRAGQKILIVIAAGSNDIDYAARNSNPGLAVAPASCSQATYTGSPNYITDALLPQIALVKAMYPTADIAFAGMLVRSLDTTENGKFVDILKCVIANRATYGIKYVFDSRQIPQFTPTNPSLSQDLTYVQDQTHPTPKGDQILAPYWRALYDLELGFTPNATYAAAIVTP